MSDPTRYPVRHTPVIRTISKVGLGSSTINAQLIGYNYGTPVRPVYLVQAFYDGTGYWSNAVAQIITVSTSSPAMWAVTWSKVPGATHYRVYRYPYGDTSKTLQIYAGDGKSIINPSSKAQTDFTFIDTIDDSTSFLTKGRPGTWISARATANAEKLIDLRPAEAQKAPTSVPIVKIGKKRFVDLSGRPIENRNLELIQKTRGFRRVLPFEMWAPLGTAAAQTIMELFASKAAYPAGPTTPGLEMHLTLNAGDATLPAYSSSMPNTNTEWREVLLVGDFELGGYMDGNLVAYAQGEFWDAKTLDSMFPEITPDGGMGMW